MTTSVDLRDLRYFETIAELGHLGRAADRLCLTQPALTRCVRRLEELFDTALFQRAGRGIKLTPAGDALLAHARRLHVVADETVREMHDFAHGESGQIKLGVVPTAAHFLLPALCRALIEAAPAVTLKTLIGQDDLLAASLTAGDLDAVISLGMRTDERFVAHTIVDDVMVVAASSAHEVFRRRGRIRIQDLSAFRWVLAAPSVESRRWLDAAFEVRGLERPIAQIETNLVLLLPRLIAQSKLLTFMSRRHLGPSGIGASLKEVPIKETTMRRTFKVIHRKTTYLSPAASKLVELVRTQGSKLV
jgi:DNA-binding transcriptional LysR family regulator